MSRPLLPPRGLFVSADVLFDPGIPAPQRETLLQVMALAWKSGEHVTPPLSYALLERITGKPARTLRGHLAALKTYRAALRLQTVEDGQFVLTLAGWLYKGPHQLENGAGASQKRGENPPAPDQEEELSSVDSLNVLLLDSHDHIHNERAAAKNRLRTVSSTGRSGANIPDAGLPTESSGLPQGLAKSLVKAGLFTCLLDEVGRLAEQGGYAPRDLKALMAWCAADQPDSPARLFMGRLRMGGRAPKMYYNKPCGSCGQYGSHAPDCRARFMSYESY